MKAVIYVPLHIDSSVFSVLVNWVEDVQERGYKHYRYVDEDLNYWVTLQTKGSVSFPVLPVNSDGIIVEAEAEDYETMFQVVLRDGIWLWYVNEDSKEETLYATYEYIKRHGVTYDG